MASNVGGIPEIATEGIDRLVPPGDPAAWADAIAQQLSQGNGTSDRRGKLFTWPDAAQAVTRLFQALPGISGPCCPLPGKDARLHLEANEEA